VELMRVGAKGSEKPVLKDGDAYYSLEGVVEDITPDFWLNGGPEAVAAAHAEGRLEPTSIEGLRIGAPVVPGSVLCIGQNYAKHAAESGAEPPKHPIVFFKTPNTVTGPYDAVGLPPGSEKSDWEVELCIVIGTQAAYLNSAEEGLAAVGGYLLANDLSERAYQMEVSGGQWSKGKCVKDFMPLGPVLVTADSFDPSACGIRSWVNGEPRQDSTTADMIFSVGEIVRDLSQYMQLEPGDIISTGTPEGVAFGGKYPYLVEGDVTEVEIDGLGRQRQEYYRIGA
jgi:2-keto-4-pentenoate hydratase/2-oxohepta-3-ene-1,7-dioic acid hydratase in catechol pathway